ncbi:MULTISPECIES: DUF1697 domain-containing protein [Streptococcus]|uniref:DUF1697 domain-containing protein n=1 Tax=Streptococcus caledonicus TaxID=2614158 RepID=A0ABW0UE72_9STRE|nr:DUF1697 domain-containing protein [Streptococcus sp. S784/96/1]
MTSYLLLLRGINLGKNNKVSMLELREQLEKLGLQTVSSYINTGNLFFDSEKTLTELENVIEAFFLKTYDFSIPFVIVPSEMVIKEVLPSWWSEDAYRKDALFYLKGTTKELVAEIIKEWSLADEDLYLGETALFWLTRTKESYTKTAHAKKITAKPFNQMVTLRNANTFNKLISLAKEKR